MSGITLAKSSNAAIPTPSANKITLFTNWDLGPVYKDDAGTVHELQGEDGELTYQNHGNTGATETIDLSAANVHRLVLDANCTISTTGWPASGTPGIGRLLVVQDATGSRTVTWPAAFTWGAPGAPTLQTAANAVDVIDIQSYDGGTTIYASTPRDTDASLFFSDVTTNNVSTSKHGFVPKISGSDGDVLTKSGAAAVWSTPAGGSFSADSHMSKTLQFIPAHAKANTNWSTLTGGDGTQYINMGRESTGAQNAEFTYDQAMSAGTWSVFVIHIKGTDRGIISVQIDSVEVGTIDTYNGSLSRNQVGSVTGISVAATGQKEIKLKMATKNASSSSYYGTVNLITWIRTA